MEHDKHSLVNNLHAINGYSLPLQCLLNLPISNEHC